MPNKEELVEYLATKEHDSWSRWMQYLFATCENHNDGSVTIPTDLVLRWSRQARTPYAELSEREKQSDRDEIVHILPLIAVKNVPSLSKDTKKGLIHAIEVSLTKHHIESLEVMIGQESVDKMHKEVLDFLEWLNSSESAN